MSNEAKVKVEPVQVTPSAIKADLAAGLNRKEIAVKYGVPKAQVDKIFKDPRIAGNRPKGKASLVLIDDEPETAVNAEQAVGAPAPLPTAEVPAPGSSDEEEAAGL
jgi:hypothetical protein